MNRLQLQAPDADVNSLEETDVRRVYYAHPKPLYGTPVERAHIRLIRRLFPGCEVLNPSRYQDFPSGRGIMAHYFRLVDRCDALVFTRLFDEIPAGVGREVNYAIREGLPVLEIEISRVNRVRRPVDHLNVRETRKRIREYLATTYQTTDTR